MDSSGKRFRPNYYLQEIFFGKKNLKKKGWNQTQYESVIKRPLKLMDNAYKV